MKPEKTNEEGSAKKAGGNSIARRRREGEDFSASFSALQDAVRSACARHTKWEERIAAGIYASLDFAAARPRAASAVTIDARREEGSEREREVIAYFAELLGEGAPRESRVGVSSDEAVIESIATVVRGWLVAGDAGRLPELAPELVYLALMPYTGIVEARSWSESPVLSKASGTS